LLREHQGVRAVGTATVCENVSKPVGAITTRQNWPELAETRPLLANANEPDRFTIHNNNMNQRYILFRRTEVFYYEDKITGKQLSLRTKDEAEAKILLNAKNESFRQPILNLQIAKAYLIGSDNGIATRTWQNAIEALIATKQGSNQHRWQTAAKDKAFVPLMPRIIIETNGELLLKVMQAGTVNDDMARMLALIGAHWVFIM
jgi:hypothetical protein